MDLPCAVRLAPGIETEQHARDLVRIRSFASGVQEA